MEFSDALFVSHAKRKYKYPRNHLTDKIKVMQALRLQIQSYRCGALAQEKKGARQTVQNLIHKLKKMVDQTKEEFDMGGWVHMAPDTFEFQYFSFMCSNYEVYGYYCLGLLYLVLDMSKEGTTLKSVTTKKLEIFTSRRRLNLREIMHVNWKTP